MKRMFPMILLFALLLCVPVRADELTLDAPSALLMEKQTGTVLFAKDEHTPREPASVTKVMTLLLTMDAIDSGALSYDDTVTGSAHAASMGGSQIWLKEGEQMRVEDLIKAVCVVSGNDAAVALGEHLAGSEEAFVAMMNEKAAALGLTNTHFMNTSGLHDENHYSTVREIALILQAALENETCAEILSAENYRASETEQHPDGLAMTNKFLYRVHHEYALNGAEITAAKTGYTTEAMNCCASAGKTPDGRSVICVTANAWTGDFCIEDHIALYTKYCGSTEAE